MRRWAVYFVIILLLNILILFQFPYGTVNLDRILAYGIDPIVETVGLFAYVFNKQILTPKFWKIVFWYLIGMLALRTIYHLTPIGTVVNLDFIFGEQLKGSNQQLLTSLALGIVFFVLLILPMFYAMYNLGNGKTRSANQKSKQTKKKTKK